MQQLSRMGLLNTWLGAETAPAALKGPTSGDLLKSPVEVHKASFMTPEISEQQNKPAPNLAYRITQLQTAL